MEQNFYRFLRFFGESEMLVALNRGFSGIKVIDPFTNFEICPGMHSLDHFKLCTLLPCL